MEDKDYSYQEDHIELQDGNNTTGYRENKVQNVPSPSPLDKEPSLIGRGPNTDVGSTLIQVITQDPGKDDLVGRLGCSGIKHLPLLLHYTEYVGPRVDEKVL